MIKRLRQWEAELGTTHLARFYAVGLLLFVLPYTRDLFVKIIPITLLLVFGLALYRNKDWRVKTVLCFLFIVLTSFFVEAIGVATGALFGAYAYETGLGVKWLDTPLLIGLNWLFLVYASHSIVSRITGNPILRILSGGIAMVGYDLVLEVAAPAMQMWSFQSGYPPFINFLTWFIMAVIYHSLFVALKIKADNPLAGKIFWVQISFFMCISLFHIFFMP